MSDWLGIATAGANMLMSSEQHRRQKEYMDIQKNNQKELSKYGHDLSYDMWLKTNYKAQRDQMLKAGLNPGLLYGQQGQGGSTQFGSAGSAQGGSPGSMPYMDVMQAGLLKAQKENIEKDTELKDVEKEKTGSEINMVNANIEKLKADTGLTQQITEWQKIENRVATASEGLRVDMLSQELVKVSGEAISATLQGIFDEATFTDRVEQVGLVNLGIAIENGLKQKQTELTEQQIEESVTKLQQGWKELSIKLAQNALQFRSLNQKDRELSQKDVELLIKQQQTDIQEFTAKWKANNPAIWELTGGVLQGSAYSIADRVNNLMPDWVNNLFKNNKPGKKFE